MDWDTETYLNGISRLFSQCVGQTQAKVAAKEKKTVLVAGLQSEALCGLHFCQSPVCGLQYLLAQLKAGSEVTDGLVALVCSGDMIPTAAV